MNQIYLTDEEANEILEKLDELSLKEIRHNDNLMTAIAKLNRSVVYSAPFAGSRAVKPGKEMWYVDLDAGKVNAIKAICALMGYGLKEAMDYVNGYDTVWEMDVKLNDHWIPVDPFTCRVSTFSDALNVLTDANINGSILRMGFVEY